ncbi:MAG TPA: hypothetical protein VIZ18_07565 [Ktedonobacteraceae bacterium]
MKETQQPEAIENAVEALPAPQGIGMAVAFDWGLAVQIFVTPITVALFNLPAEAKFPGLNPTFSNVLLFVVAWPVALGLVLYGEMVRRGRNWARRIQIVANALLSVVGIVQLVSLFQSIKGGNSWPVVTEVILVIFSPLIFWRLTRPATARWFKKVTVAEARKRHGGAWPWLIAIWAIVGGVLQAIAAIK